MEPARPSQTALRVAMRRAAHQLYDAPPLVLDDPIAVRILGPHAEEIERTPGRNPQINRGRSPSPCAPSSSRAAATRKTSSPRQSPAASPSTCCSAPASTPSPTAIPTPTSASSRSTIPPRSSGSANSCSPAACPLPPTSPTFPSTSSVNPSPTSSVTPASTPASPSFFAWLGVVPYLTREAFRATVRFIAAQPPGSGLVFDYGQPREALSFREQLAFDSLAARVHLAGEGFQLFFTPAKVAAELAAFYDLEDLGSPELNERYFANRTDSLRAMGSAGRIVSAWL